MTDPNSTIIQPRSMESAPHSSGEIAFTPDTPFTRKLNGYAPQEVDNRIATMRQQIAGLQLNAQNLQDEILRLTNENTRLKTGLTDANARLESANTEMDKLRHAQENPMAAVGEAAQAYYNNCVDKGRQLVADATAKAKDIVANANAQALKDTEKIRADAQATLDKARGEAKRLADETVEKARKADEANAKRVKDAEARAASIVQAAQEKATALDKALQERAAKADARVRTADEHVNEVRRRLSDSLNALNAHD